MIDRGLFLRERYDERASMPRLPPGLNGTAPQPEQTAPVPDWIVSADRYALQAPTRKAGVRGGSDERDTDFSTPAAEATAAELQQDRVIRALLGGMNYCRRNDSA